MAMQNVKILSTVADVVEAFGGTSKTAEWAGIGDSAVSMWLARGFIPPGWHFRMQAYFEPKKLVLSPTVFGAELAPPENPKQRRGAFQPAA